MIKRTLYIFAATALLLQACSTGKSFSKKRYGNLKWIDHNTEVEVPGKDPKAAGLADKTTSYEKTDMVIPVTEKKQENFTHQEPVVSKTQPAAQPVTQSLPSSKPFEKAEKQVNEESVSETKNVAEVSESIVGQKQGQHTLGSPKPMMDDDAKLIICVILAILIPPLAMYVWDQNTDTWFVVDLILFLCLFLFFFGPFGLFGLLAIVIALLRIFGML